MQRRNFITLLGGAVGWPLAVRAQQPDRVRQIGVLMPLAADEPEAQTRITACQQELQQWGWPMGRKVGTDMRLVPPPADIRKHAAELVALAPDVILANGAAAVEPLLQASRSVPIVFA